jgi:UDPglucose 6-dehydrogenase
MPFLLLNVNNYREITSTRLSQKKVKVRSNYHRHLSLSKKLLHSSIWQRFYKKEPSMRQSFRKYWIFPLLILFHSFIYSSDEKTLPSHEITMIGTGYVGLVAGACLADFGHVVTCCDIEKSKIDLLNEGHLPIYENGLDDIIRRARDNNRLFFTHEVAKAIRKNPIIFIAVGTPSQKNDEPDLTAIKQVARVCGENLNAPKTFFIKSTVPIGTVRLFQELIRKHSQSNIPFEIGYSPEFLREGSSVKDFCEPDRVILGTESKTARQTFCEIFHPLHQKNIPFQFTSIESAEIIKYAANSFLAVKISFINEMADLCDACHADIAEVAMGIGSDHRIGPFFLKPGPGYGGSCLPKDTTAFFHEAEKLNINLKILSATIEINKNRPNQIIQKLKNLLETSLQGKTIALLGLAFKENTDDVRESPSLKIIENLLLDDAYIKAYDPVAIMNMKKIYPQIEYCESIEDTTRDADAVILMTPWEEFSNIDLGHMRTLMKHPILLDTRNCFEPEQLLLNGFIFDNMGRSKSATKEMIQKTCN